jgi:hypothetical protein
MKFTKFKIQFFGADDLGAPVSKPGPIFKGEPAGTSKTAQPTSLPATNLETRVKML